MEDIDVDMTLDDNVNTEEIIQIWKEKFKNNALTTLDFEEHWRIWVPKIYSPTLNESFLNWNFNEELAQKVLFNTLEEYIFNGNAAQVIDHYSQTLKAPSVCGRVFKMGEPTYSCRECGMDRTCVLCVDCFKKSQHRFHKYKMGTSQGGGCCDCGDVEAWKKDPFCSIHLEGTSPETPKQSLPDDMKMRTYLVFESVLWYTYKLLTTEQITDVRLGHSSDDFFGIDKYCTILYNDEVHTFEQVITTLSRVLKCNQRNAIEYVTNIDREGRSIVMCHTFQHCSDLKHEIEKYTSRHGNVPLKVLVNHAFIIAHQHYAMKLLAWLQNFLGHGEQFRAIFAELATKTNPPQPCIIKGILQRDSSLWKSARTQWHHILISGMLLEYENKKTLAKIFTKNYGHVMKDFIKDDHDHSFSVSSLSVQLFTVPTLAHYLIAYDDVLFILLNAFLSECKNKCNVTGKLQFERNPVSQPFKRALYMLYDLRYLLGSIPETWNDDLRRCFLHGLTYMLDLLTMMQGMDAVTRQIGQHMEYEPEWESGFNLNIKLSACISLALEWCGTDKVVLIKAYRAILKKLEENPCYDPNDTLEVRELADHSTACLHYDVSTKPVSIHTPLTRFFAALHLHLEKYNLHYDGAEFQVTKPTPVQIIEPVLRAQVMIAQVHAGMWRRNGYALLNTLFFYHNVKCRTEMLDRDITVLQIGASLLESNEFLIHVLNKFNLLNWAMLDFETTSLKSSSEEDSMRTTINLVEEFLHLLIVIVGERHMPGVSVCTVQDRLKKEILQYLSIKPLPHSELSKTIPEDLYEECEIDEIIQELATFKKPSQTTGIGVYELKPEYYDQYNVFFYHYTREELSKSEESQRRRRKAAGELECCPPPKLPKLTESFSMLVNLLQCDVMLHIFQTVLERCNNLKARSFSEPQLHKVLHLIGYALQEEESKNYPFFKFVENSQKFQIFKLMEELLTCLRVDAHKGLLQWTINKFKEVANVKETTPMQAVVVEEETPKVDDEKERRAKLAAERRAKIMQQMQAMQNSFIKSNATLFEESTTKSPAIQEQEIAMDVTEPTENKTVALGPNHSARNGIEKSFTCILCQEETKVSANGPTLVLAAFVHQATVLCQSRNNEDLMEPHKHEPLFLNANLGPAPHTSTCGHVMHSDCWRKYFDNVMSREHRRPYRLRHPTSFNVDKQEFLCPLCECLSNTVLPLVPPLSILQPNVDTTDISFEQWMYCIDIMLSRKNKVCHGIFKCYMNDECPNEHCEACINSSNGSAIEPDTIPKPCEANCILQPHQVFYSCPLDTNKIEQLPDIFINMFSREYTELDNEMKEMVQVFAQVTYTRALNVGPHPTDKRLVPMAWKSLAYTIHSVETTLRDSNKPLLGHLSSRQRDCLENLVRIVGVLASTKNQNVIISSHALNLLYIILDHNENCSSILEWDSLGFLISLTFSMPSLASKDGPTPAPCGSTLDMHILRLVFSAHVTKILLLMDINEIQSPMDSVNQEEDDCLASLLFNIKKYYDGLSNQAVWDYVKYASMPFLRCCALFYQYLTDVPPPSVLQELGGDTFENICEYLSLPTTPFDVLGPKVINALVDKWISHKDVKAYLKGNRGLLHIKEPLPVNKLIDLPNDYSELINTVSSFTCPNSDSEDSRNPTMCLVCGEILCSQSYCCQTEINSNGNKVNVGACNYHAMKCGAGAGIFLRVRECEVIFLASPHRGCHVSPPYLDDYGETDQGLRRGNPLKLCEERYKKLHSIWLSHSIHEEITRSIESSNHMLSTQWNLL